MAYVRQLGKGNTAEAAHQKDSSTSAFADQRKHHTTVATNGMLKPYQQQHASDISSSTQQTTSRSSLGPQPRVAASAAGSKGMAAKSAASSFSIGSATDSVHSKQRTGLPVTPPFSIAPVARAKAPAGPPTSQSVSQPVRKSAPCQEEKGHRQTRLPFRGTEATAAATPAAAISQMTDRAGVAGQAVQSKAAQGSTGASSADRHSMQVAAGARPDITPPNAAGVKSLLFASATKTSAAGRRTFQRPAAAAAGRGGGGAVSASMKPAPASTDLKGAKPAGAAGSGRATTAGVQPTPSPVGKFTLLVTPGGPSWPANTKGIGLVPYSITPPARISARTGAVTTPCGSTSGSTAAGRRGGSSSSSSKPVQSVKAAGGHVDGIPQSNLAAQLEDLAEQFNHDKIAAQAGGSSSSRSAGHRMRQASAAAGRLSTPGSSRRNGRKGSAVHAAQATEVDGSTVTVRMAATAASTAAASSLTFRFMAGSPTHDDESASSQKMPTPATSEGWGLGRNASRGSSDALRAAAGGAAACKPAAALLPGPHPLNSHAAENSAVEGLDSAMKALGEPQQLEEAAASGNSGPAGGTPGGSWLRGPGPAWGGSADVVLAGEAWAADEHEAAAFVGCGGVVE
eukprot:gene776-1089_t